VSHALGGSAIRLLGVSNGNSWEVSNWSVTNGAGMFVAYGNFPAHAEGFHQLRIDVAGALSNTVSFTVSACGR
jgi:hypothetical protein